MMRHSNIIVFFFLVEEPDFTFLFFELAEGGELFDRIGERFLCLQTSLPLARMSA